MIQTLLTRATLIDAQLCIYQTDRFFLFRLAQMARKIGPDQLNLHVQSGVNTGMRATEWPNGTQSRPNKQWRLAEEHTELNMLLVGDSTIKHVSAKAMLTRCYPNVTVANVAVNY